MDLVSIGTGLASGLFAMVGWKAINMLIDFLKIKQALKSNLSKFGYMAGLSVYNKGVKYISDKTTREKTIMLLDKGGNDLDFGWDLGIRGLPYVEPK